MMTLNEWLKEWPYARVDHANQAPCVIVPDGIPPRGNLRRQAWRLLDYRVTSVTAGAIYFMPKTN